MVVGISAGEDPGSTCGVGGLPTALVRVSFSTSRLCLFCFLTISCLAAGRIRPFHPSKVEPGDRLRIICSPNITASGSMWWFCLRLCTVDEAAAVRRVTGSGQRTFGPRPGLSLSFSAREDIEPKLLGIG